MSFGKFAPVPRTTERLQHHWQAILLNFAADFHSVMFSAGPAIHAPALFGSAIVDRKETAGAFVARERHSERDSSGSLDLYADSLKQPNIYFVRVQKFRHHHVATFLHGFALLSVGAPKIA